MHDYQGRDRLAEKGRLLWAVIKRGLLGICQGPDLSFGVSEQCWDWFILCLSQQKTELPTSYCKHLQSSSLSEAIQAGHNSEHCLFLFHKGLLLETTEISNLESLRCKWQTVFHSGKTAWEWSPTGTKWFLSAVIVTDALWEWLSTCPRKVPSWPINCTLIFVGHIWLFPESFSFPSFVFSVTLSPPGWILSLNCLSSGQSCQKPKPSPSLSCRLALPGFSSLPANKTPLNSQVPNSWCLPSHILGLKSQPSRFCLESTATPVSVQL